jgi:hypothetical protein
MEIMPTERTTPERLPANKRRQNHGHRRRRYPAMVADGRVLGLSAGDWSMLAGGFALMALAVWLW